MLTQEPLLAPVDVLSTCSRQSCRCPCSVVPLRPPA